MDDITAENKEILKAGTDFTSALENPNAIDPSFLSRITLAGAYSGRYSDEQNLLYINLVIKLRLEDRITAQTLAMAIEQVGLLDDPRIADSLIDLLDYPHTLVVEKAMQALSARKEERAIDKLTILASMDYSAFLKLERLNKARRCEGVYKEITDVARKALASMT